MFVGFSYTMMHCDLVTVICRMLSVSFLHICISGVCICTGAKKVVRSVCDNSNGFEVKVTVHQGSALSPLLFVIVIEASSREFGVALPWELLYADDLIVIAETEDDQIKRLNELKDNVENRGMRVNINKAKVMISREWQKVMHKAVRWPCGVCDRAIGNN